jgi:hypothetical protein
VLHRSAVRRLGCSAVRLFGCSFVWRFGGSAVRRVGGSAVGRLCGLAVRRFGPIIFLLCFFLRVGRNSEKYENDEESITFA